MRIEAAECMSGLDWARREDMYKFLMALDLADDEHQMTLSAFADGAPVEAAPYVWAEVDSGRTLSQLSVPYAALLSVYLGERGRYDDSARVPANVKSLAEEASKRMTSPDERMRTLALGLLASADAAKAATRAEELYAAAETPAGERRNALAMLMLLMPDRQVKRAVEGVGAADAEMKLLALEFLSKGSNSAACQSLILPEDTLYISANHEGSYDATKVPDSLAAAALEPLLTNAKRDIRIDAAYLLAKKGRASGMDVLMTAWRESEDTETQGLLVDAIVALNDDSQTAVLENVYASLDREYTYYVRDFYWKIRAMQGPKILALRKRIRDEVGMENLR